MLKTSKWNEMNTGEFSHEITYRWKQSKKEKNSESDGFLAFQEYERLKDQRPVSLI